MKKFNFIAIFCLIAVSARTQTSIGLIYGTDVSSLDVRFVSWAGWELAEEAKGFQYQSTLKGIRLEQQFNPRLIGSLAIDHVENKMMTDIFSHYGWDSSVLTDFRFQYVNSSASLNLVLISNLRIGTGLTFLRSLGFAESRAINGHSFQGWRHHGKKNELGLTFSTSYKLWGFFVIGSYYHGLKDWGTFLDVKPIRSYQFAGGYMLDLNKLSKLKLRRKKKVNCPKL